MLRLNRPFAECRFQGDEHGRTFHLGAFEEGKLVSVASFYYQNNPAVAEDHQFRLRGMATLPKFQRRGLSSALLRTAFPLIKQNLCQVVWCNARQEAYPFYQKVGFDFWGEEFDVPHIGPHTLMTKRFLHF